MKFENKIIFILSRENFEGMLMSKQHYAIELSRMGNLVYFINHPDLRKVLKRGSINIEKTKYQNLIVVNHRFLHPYFFKFKFIKLYNFLTYLHIRRLEYIIGKKPDIVWNFDIGNSLPLRFFKRKVRKIYMPVDGPYATNQEKDAVKSAEIIISVADKILNQYENSNVPKYLISHGVSEVFLNQASAFKKPNKIRVGYAGSLLRNDLDLKFIKTIIEKYHDIIFEFWGENSPLKSNIHFSQDISEETNDFLSFMHNSTNVILHGIKNPDELAKGIKKVDILLLFYRPNQDNTQNSHKILEYLASGKVIVSSFMSSYQNEPDLIEMLQTPNNNEGLIELFDHVINNLKNYNSTEKQQKRINFASSNTYKSQIKKIEKFLTDLGK